MRSGERKEFNHKKAKRLTASFFDNFILTIGLRRQTYRFSLPTTHSHQPLFVLHRFPVSQKLLNANVSKSVLCHLHNDFKRDR